MTTVILTSGSSWSRPGNCPNILDTVECWGCGGNGKGLYHIDDSGGYGGGGGAYAKKSNYNIGLRSTINIQIPQGDGTQSITYFDNSSSGIVADYGRVATSVSYGAGGSSSSCVGDIKYSGGRGGYSQIGAWGGGGGAASNQGPGSPGGSGYGSTNGDGGNSGAGGGVGGSAKSTSGLYQGGNGGSDPDGGGGGGASLGNGGNPGGGGAGGYYNRRNKSSGGRAQITITYTPLTNIVLSIIESRCKL